MSKSFSLEQLTEGIRQRNLGSQNVQLVEKWARTGLLRGLDGVKRENMARMMENQASQVLKEQSSLSGGGGGGVNSGDMRGFTNIAFPIVRRVFGGLIANDLVSIQPMSLPSGLLFYLDYTRGTQVGQSADAQGGAAHEAGESIYNDPVGKGVQSGSLGTGGQYDLAGSGYSRVYKEDITVIFAVAGVNALSRAFTMNAAGTASIAANGVALASVATTGKAAKLLQFDSQIIDRIENKGEAYHFHVVPWTTANFSGIDESMVKNIVLHDTDGNGAPSDGLSVSSEVQSGTSLNVRRLNRLVKLTALSTTDANLTPANIQGLEFQGLAALDTPDIGVLMVVRVNAATTYATADLNSAALDVSYVMADSLASGDGSSLVVPSFESDFGTGATSPAIPEIDIKVEALPVVAQTRKLRARWSPELAQDLNAYHSLDAEVELTQILSEQIALEIDREILNDLLTQASAANYYWSRAPGKFLNKATGVGVNKTSSLAGGPSFTGTVREWYETLVETIIDVANQIHRKTLRGSANFIVVSPDVATILEASVLYKPSFSLDGDGQVSGMVIGAEKVGTLSNRFTVYKDPYFPRNKVLVGYKGGSYLETGYVYAPYVPLIVTPTIFAPEDFTPRKGVMTRYGKKMVRSDFYGTVTCADMSVI
jgi:hypothetical protein